MAALRFTGGQRRQMGIQAKASTVHVSTQADISLQQRLDVVWQSHVLEPSTRVDCRRPSEDSDVGSSDHDDNDFESANDPRRTSNSHGPAIAALDSLETYSDDRFFDFEELGRAEVQEEMIDNAESHNGNRIELSPAGDIDSDGEVTLFQKSISAALMTRRVPMLGSDVTVRNDGYVDESEFDEPLIALRRLSSHDLPSTLLGLMRIAAHH
jgi:hypothetical protein